MARKEIDIKIDTEGRDYGKVFHMVEMSALDAEDWAMRAGVTLAKFGFQISDSYAGMAGIAAVGYQNIAAASVGVPEIRELMAEMMGCIKVPITDQKQGRVIDHRPMVKDDIEEITTVLKLRLEVFQLHTGFSIAELYQKWTSAKTSQQGLPDTQATPQL